MVPVAALVVLFVDLLDLLALLEVRIGLNISFVTMVRTVVIRAITAVIRAIMVIMAVIMVIMAAMAMALTVLSASSRTFSSLLV